MEPVVMGILNCTPDSFFEGSRKQSDYEIASRTNEIISEGGAMIDVGAFSTRPGAADVSLEEEMTRMRMALAVIRRESGDVVLSIDTFRPEVARMGVEEFGVSIVNDVSEGGIGGIADGKCAGMSQRDVPEMFREVARLHVGYVLMSVQPDVDSMLEHFRREVDELRTLGVERIILDPGFGFGKDTVADNFRVLDGMPRLRSEFPDLPLLAGVSRKRMIWQLLGCTAQDEDALRGTMLVNLLALERGARILRVHDVKEAADTIRIFRQTNSNNPQNPQ